MQPFRPLSAIEQLANHLREEILRGGLGDSMPGVHRLAKELGVGPRTVIAAVAQLEREGLLRGQGPRRRSRTVATEDFSAPALRVSIMLYEDSDRTLFFLLDLLHRLQAAGQTASFASGTLRDFSMNEKKVARFVRENPADAWVVVGGSREVLGWFAKQPVPTFALFGRRRDVRIAGGGPDKMPAIAKVVNRLVELGHRRIVLLVREERRKPQPGLFERTFLEVLAEHGLPIGSYNLPDWQDSAESFRRCLDSLFHVTPPTALIIDQSFLFTVAQQHLARRGMVAPQHVSLVCADPDPVFAWFHPSVAHIHWDPHQVTRRILRWVNHVARGRSDYHQTLTKATFIEGGTIGPPRERGS